MAILTLNKFQYLEQNYREGNYVNESLNNMIWSKCPKNIFVGRKTFSHFTV